MNIKFKILPFLTGLMLLVVSACEPQPSETAGTSSMIGFTPAGEAAQLELEAQFDSYLDAESHREWLKIMSAEPNHVGSPYTKKNAEYVRDLINGWGIETKLEVFHVLFPTPEERVLELLEPSKFTAKLIEPPIEGDPSTFIYEGTLPPYNAYSADGDVTGEIVYVNQGLPDDYKVLEENGISVEGKIVFARYGGSWRGIKPRLAYEHGAIGCIIYSDPRDDGYRVGETYPEGAFRPEDGVQRGSVMNMTLYPGDPLTPGVGATEDAERLSREEAETIKKIPVMPISYADARPFLEAMEGPVAPQAWQGSLPITYRLGGGPAKAHFKLSFNWDIVPVYNTISIIEGSEYPDQWIVRGNHRDGWVFGAADPLSGLVAELDEIRAMGELLKTGWRPKRTIVYASWDGEEQGLLGSTEWAEHHKDELRKKGVLYINTDGNGRGFLGVGGSHSLQKIMNQIQRDVKDPVQDVSLLERNRARRLMAGNKAAQGDGDLSISALGSGSDYSSFLQHVGLPSLNLGFSGESGGGVYHSRYDTFEHYVRFNDFDFAYGVALSQVVGRTVLRFANADVLPYYYTDMAETVETYIDEIEEMSVEMRSEREFEHSLHGSNAYVLAANPTKTYNPPAQGDVIPDIDFTPLRTAVAGLKRAASNYDSRLASRLQKSSDMSEDQLLDLNTQLQAVPQGLLSEDGLPERPWYKNTMYAPGFYTGYGVKTMPGVREAVELENWSRTDHMIDVTASAIREYTSRIEEAAKLIK